MATTLNMRFRTDVLAWAQTLSDETGLSVARIVELAVLRARDENWRPTGGRPRLRRTSPDVNDQVGDRPL